MAGFSVSMVTGIVFLCIFVVFFIGFIVLCLIQQKNKNRRQVQQLRPTHTVAIMNGHFASQPGSHPLPAGYASHYNPAYYNMSGPPSYETPTAPPPAYNYESHAPKYGQQSTFIPNPFGEAAASSGSTTQER